MAGLAVLCAVSCKDDQGQVVKPAEVSLVVSPLSLAFTAEGGVQSISVETNASTVEISDNLSWLAVEKTDTGFSVEASANEQTEARNGVLTVFAIDGDVRKSAEVKVSQAGAEVPEPEQFADEEFKRLMLEACDADGDGFISQEEADKVTELDLSYDSESTDRSVIGSLDGIRIFRNLKNLDCDFNAITSLDLSGMDKLEYVNCSYNKIASLNLQGCTSLMQVYANVNELTSLDLSGCENIKFVQAYKNRLTSFELKDKAELGYLDVSQNSLTSIKVSGCPKLGILNCGSNNLTSLELVDLPYLYSLGCYGNSLVSLDVSGLPGLLLLECYDNNLTSLDLSECPTLGSVRCSNNLLETLALPAVDKELVTYVVCDGNRLTAMDVTMYPNIKQLVCNNNFITDLKVDGCSMLQTLSAENNSLAELSLKGMNGLVSLVCKSNSLKELSIRECPAVESVDARENPLETLWINADQKTRDIKTDNNDDIVKVWRDKPVVSLVSKDYTFTGDGGDLTLSFAVENPVEGESLVATTEADWLTVKNEGELNLVLTAAANASSESRVADVVVEYADADRIVVSVLQEASAKLTLKVELTKVWYESAEFKVTPSRADATFIAYARPKSKVESYADDEALIKADIERFSEWGTIASSGNFYSGEQTVSGSFSRWTSKDYYVVVYGLTEDGTRTTDEVVKIPFTLADSQPYISAGSVAEVPVEGGTFTVSYIIENEREGEPVTVESMDKKWLHIDSVDTSAHTITFTVDECTQISYSYPYKREGSFIIYHADASPCTVDLKQKCPTSSN